MMAPAPASALPDDVLVEILRHLAPLVLAASRRVCRSWRDAVDARLRGHLLSRSVRGIFINYAGHGLSEFFSRPSTGTAICGGLDFLPSAGVKVADHCDGLLLCRDTERDYVVNPATRRWARLPRRPPPRMPGFGQSAYLAFDHAASPHYEVFLIPRLPGAGQSDKDEALLRSAEWPPAAYVLHVFSSTDGRWKERTFLREGEAAGIVGDMDSDLWYHQYHAVYQGRALYIHCQHGYLTRMSLSDHTYKVIRLPCADELTGYPNYHVGKSLRGVYCEKKDDQNRLQLWHLDESGDQTEWISKHDIDLESFLHKFHELTCRKRFKEGQQMRGPWILQDVNYRKQMEGHHGLGGNRKYGAVGEKYDWNSDEDDVLDIEDDATEWNYDRGYQFLGFHPYKEVVYLELSMGRGVAYDWNGSKFQDLGSVEPEDHHYVQEGTHTAFPYTPCWMGQFPGNELECLLEDEEMARKESELEAQIEDPGNFTCVDEYEMRKFSGRGKRVKDSAAKIRRRGRIAAW